VTGVQTCALPILEVHVEEEQLKLKVNVHIHTCSVKSGSSFLTFCNTSTAL
jgi:hypothetical protein